MPFEILTCQFNCGHNKHLESGAPGVRWEGRHVYWDIYCIHLMCINAGEVVCVGVWDNDRLSPHCDVEPEL